MRPFFSISCIIFLLQLVVALPVMAGDYCIGGIGLPLQCIYDDVESCARAAEPPSTACILNSEARVHITGQSEYCVIHSGGVGECVYVDRESDPYIYDTRIQR
jgi:hypothetical protein